MKKIMQRQFEHVSRTQKENKKNNKKQKETISESTSVFSYLGAFVSYRFQAS